MASIIAAIYNQNRKRSQKALTADDVLGTKPPKRPMARTPEEQLATLREITLAMGGTIKER